MCVRERGRYIVREEREREIDSERGEREGDR